LGEKVGFRGSLAWQLLFFGGYLLGAGWVRIPLGGNRPLLTSWAIVLIAIPFSHEATLRPFAWMADTYGHLEPWFEKTRLGPLRIVHFAALGYLAMTLLNRHMAWMATGPVLKIRNLGQHSLAIFALGVLLARVCGMVLDQTGHSLMPLLVINLGGLLLLIGLGQWLTWLEGKPWKQTITPKSSKFSSPLVLRFSLEDFRTLVLQPLKVGLLLLPLAVSPFLLPKKPAPIQPQNEAWQCANAAHEEVADQASLQHPPATMARTAGLWPANATDAGGDAF
jgi:hypothetical protein